MALSIHKLVLLVIIIPLLFLFAFSLAKPVQAECKIFSSSGPYDPGYLINFGISGVIPLHSIEIELNNATTGESLAEKTLQADKYGNVLFTHSAPNDSATYWWETIDTQRDCTPGTLTSPGFSVVNPESGPAGPSPIGGPSGSSNPSGGGAPSGGSDSIFNLIDDPLPEGRFTSLGGAVSQLAPFLLTLGGMVAFLFLIMGGFKYMTAQGDPKAIASARGTLTSAIIGLALLASIFVIMTIIEVVFKIIILGSLAQPAYAQVDIGKEFLFGGKGVSEVFHDFGTLIGNIVNVALGLAGVVFFVMTLWGGIRYTSAQGDEKAISDARGTLTNAVIGLLIVIASFAIIKLIAIATGASISIF